MLVVTELVRAMVCAHYPQRTRDDSQSILSVSYFRFRPLASGFCAYCIPMPFDQLTVGWSIDVRGPGPSNTARNSQSTDWTQPRAQGRASLLSQVAADGLLY